MSRLDDLERLNALREKGLFTWEEYLAEKAKLPLEGERPPKIGWRLPRNAGEAQRSYWPYLGLAIAALIVFAIKHGDRLLARGGDPVTAVAAEADDTAQGGWSFSTKTDPMTDIRSNVATQVVRGNLAVVEIAVSCASNGAIRYEAVTSDPQGEGVAMRTEPYAYGRPNYFYDLRVDDGASSTQLSASKFNNQIIAELAADHFSDWRNINGQAKAAIAGNPVVAMMRGSRVLLGLHLENGDEVVTLDQSGDEMRKLLQPCLGHADNGIARL